MHGEDLRFLGFLYGAMIRTLTEFIYIAGAHILAL